MLMRVTLVRSATAMVTCSGGVISPSQVESLRHNPDNRCIRVIGTDVNVPCIGQYSADKFYQVPPGTAPNYVDIVKEICVKEKVDVVFPASHEEALALTDAQEVFDDLGIVLAISKHDVLELSFNKKLAYEKLKAAGLPCPDFRSVGSVEEFEVVAKELGIEKRKLVMKPVLGRGGRGTRILTKGNTAWEVLNEKPGSLEANYDEVKRMLSKLDPASFPELLLMQYLPGKIYSVDFLAKNGEALIVVPKVRIMGNASQTIVGQVERNTLVEETIRKICREFGFDYNINIEMGCNEEGVPLPFDLNPRIAASVAFCTAAGANLIYFALKMALGETVPEVQVKNKVLMLRYFEARYV